MKGKLGAVLLCLVFAIPFGGVGAGATWAIATMIQDGLRARDWVLVKAEVTGPASYRYTFEGRAYDSERLGTFRLGGTSDVDDFDDRVASILAKGRDERKPITVWVNPDNPSEAMIDRAIRWSFLVFLLPFALAFGGVGIGALWMIVHTLRAPAKGQARTRRVNAPAASAGSGLGFIWFFAIVWNAIAFPIALLAVPQAWANGEWLILFVLIFPLIGVLILWSAIASTLAWLRRGKARLKLATAAPRLGAPVEGHFEFAYGVKPGDAFNVRLVCERTFRGGDDTTVNTHWTRQVAARAVESAGGVRVPFRVDAPSNQPPSDEDGSDKPVTHAWRLEIDPASRAMAFPYRHEIAMARAAFDGLHAPVVEAPVRIDPTLEQMLGSKFDAKKLTDEQKQAFARMTPEQQAKLAKFLRFVPTGRKLIITIVCLVVAIEVMPMIFALVR